MSSYRNYYDSTFGRRAESAGKAIPEPRPAPSRIATRYGGTYTSSIGSSRDSARQDSSRLKTSFIDKDTSHPPVSYKSPLSRTSTRSRDPSPSRDLSEKSTTSSSSGYLNPHRLYPKSYVRSNTSREGTLSPTGSTSNLPKLSGSIRASSSSKDSSVASKYKSSREDLSSGSQKYLTSRFLPKNSVERSYTAYTRPSTVRTHEVSRKNKELLTVLHAQQEQEKASSRPASRCSSVAPEDIPKIVKKASPEKNFECPKQTQMETVKLCTRGTSPNLGSSTHPSFLRSRRIELAKTIEKTVTRPKTVKENMIDKGIQSDRMDDSTRSSRFAGASRLSATPWTNFLDMKFNSPSNKKDKKGKQDSTESPKSLSRTSSTNSIISKKSDKDLKKPLTKSKLTPPKQLTDKKQLPPPIPKSDSSNKTNSLHSLNPLNKDFRKSVLNMNPDGNKTKIGRRSNSASSAESDNADPDATDISETLNSCRSYHTSNSSSKLPQKSTPERQQRSNRSPSSDASTTNPSSSEDDVRSRKVLSANSSRTSITADDVFIDKPLKVPQSPKSKCDQGKNEAEAKNFLMRALAPVTNLFKANRQSQSESETDRTPGETGNESEEKVFWFFDPSSESTNDQRTISQSSAEPKRATLILHKVETDTDHSSDQSKLQVMSEPINMKYGEPTDLCKPMSQCQISNPKHSSLLKQDSSGEAPWWLDSNQSIPEGVQVYSGYNAENNMTAPIIKPRIRHIESGEKPWWLDESATIPEGVDTYPNWVQQNKPEEEQLPVNQIQHKIKPVDSGEIPWWLKKDGTPPEGVKVWHHAENETSTKQKIRHIESGEAPWWLNKDFQPPEGVQTYPDWTPDQTSSPQFNKRNNSGSSTWWQESDKSNSECVRQSGLGEGHKLRHIDSGERAWWANDEELPDQSQGIKENNCEKIRYPIRHQESGESAWWLQEEDQEPLGDRASPEGLEMPKDDEQERLSPYDNVPINRVAEKKHNQISSLFISKHTNIDDILGGTGQLWSPMMDKMFKYGADGEVCREVDAKEVIIHEGISGQRLLTEESQGAKKVSRHLK